MNYFLLKSVINEKKPFVIDICIRSTVCIIKIVHIVYVIIQQLYGEYCVCLKNEKGKKKH